MFNKAKNSQRGFTVIEAVVSAAIFALTISSVIGVYLAVMSIDSKTRSQRAVQQNARFIMEFLGKETRTGSIDYLAYGGTISYQNGYATQLHLINQLGEQETITCGTDAGSDPNDPYLILDKNVGGANFSTNLNSGGVRVTRCAFYIEPSTDPFQPLGSNPPDQQPFVTVILQLTANYGSRQQNTAVINLETTFTTREYPSRQ